MPEKRPALGRGLSALIPEVPVPTPVASAESGHPTELDLDLLEPNQEQPRTEMDDARLDELAQSIKSSGIIQPILVRRRPGGTYEIVAGERRWRAAQRAGLMRVPVRLSGPVSASTTRQSSWHTLARVSTSPVLKSIAKSELYSG